VHMDVGGFNAPTPALVLPPVRIHMYFLTPAGIGLPWLPNQLPKHIALCFHAQ
jgi:hypothetical protein